jgi:GT2 family glycosyltransferase
MLSVSVVVPIYNAMRTLPSCLAAIERLDPKPLEILLVDNGSTDGTLALLCEFARAPRSFDVKVLEEPRRGAAAARNAGFRAAKGDVIVFIDSDCAPEPAWLSYLREPFRDPRVGAVAGRVVAAPAASTMELFSALYTLQLPDRPARSREWTPWEGGYVTANFAVRRSLLMEFNGIDEKSVGGTAAGSDYELCARLYARGVEIVYVPEAIVLHHHRTTLPGMMRQAFDYGQSHAYLISRKLTRGLWVDLPMYPFSWKECPVHAWLDLASADKKMLAVIILAVLYAPAFLLLIPYAVWLVVITSRRATRSGSTVTLSGRVALAGLLLLKSFAMTVGRWWGSVKYGALCL